MPELYTGLGLSCPAGGSFYVCRGAKTEFIGCCKSDPCGDGKCPTQNLTAASFSRDSYTTILKQDCDEPRGEAIWWTCASNSPPFMGCCASNPCATKSCPSADLIPAKLSSLDSNREPFVSALRVPGPVDTRSQSSGGLSGGAIAGIVLAVLVVVVGLVGGAYKWGWNRGQRRGPKYQSVNSGQGDIDPSQLDPNQVVVGGQFSPYRESYLSGATAVGRGMGSPGFPKPVAPGMSPQHNPYDMSSSYGEGSPFHQGQHTPTYPGHGRHPSDISGLGLHQPPPPAVVQELSGENRSELAGNSQGGFGGASGSVGGSINRGHRSPDLGSGYRSS